MEIKKDWRALIGNALWAWILGWLPTAWRAAEIARTQHRFDGQVFSWTSGVISQHTESIDLRRVRAINADDSPFTGGKLTFVGTDGRQVEVPFVASPEQVATRLRQLTDQTSRKNGETQNRIIF